MTTVKELKEYLDTLPDDTLVQILDSSDPLVNPGFVNLEVDNPNHVCNYEFNGKRWLEIGST